LLEQERSESSGNVEFALRKLDLNAASPNDRSATSVIRPIPRRGEPVTAEDVGVVRVHSCRPLELRGKPARRKFLPG
jgi:hypothetical protein